MSQIPTESKARGKIVNKTIDENLFNINKYN